MRPPQTLSGELAGESPRQVRGRFAGHRELSRADVPNDFQFAACHRIGIIRVANYAILGSFFGTVGGSVMLDSRVNRGAPADRRGP